MSEQLDIKKEQQFLLDVFGEEIRDDEKLMRQHLNIMEKIIQLYRIERRTCITEAKATEKEG